MEKSLESGKDSAMKKSVFGDHFSQVGKMVGNLFVEMHEMVSLSR